MILKKIETIKGLYPYLDLTIPNLKVQSPNHPSHWSAKKKFRDKISRALLASGEQNKIYFLPCTVILTRIAPRAYDEDNYIAACKTLRDYVADLIIPELKAGRADACEFIKWIYRQEKGNVKEYAINIKIYQT